MKGSGHIVVIGKETNQAVSKSLTKAFENHSEVYVVFPATPPVIPSMESRKLTRNIFSPSIQYVMVC